MYGVLQLQKKMKRAKAVSLWYRLVWAQVGVIWCCADVLLVQEMIGRGY